MKQGKTARLAQWGQSTGAGGGGPKLWRCACRPAVVLGLFCVSSQASRLKRQHEIPLLQTKHLSCFIIINSAEIHTNTSTEQKTEYRFRKHFNRKFKLFSFNTKARDHQHSCRLTATRAPAPRLLRGCSQLDRRPPPTACIVIAPSLHSVSYRL